MATLEYPIEALRDAVAAAMTAAGLTVEHKLGRKFDFTNDRPPRYVWVPTRLSGREGPTTREDTQHRTLFVMRETVSIGCWGRSVRETHALRNNLYKALHDQAYADVAPERGEWDRFNEAWNQKGELFVLEVSLRVPFIDAYATLDPDTPSVDDPSTVLPQEIEGRIEGGAEVDVDGETAVVVDTYP